MATHKSAIKRHRQSLKKRVVNRTVKGKVRTAVRDLLEAISSKDAAAAKKLLSAAEGEIRKAAVKGILHKRNAERRISRIAQQVVAMGRSKK